MIALQANFRVKIIVHLIPPRVLTALMLTAFAVSIMAQEVRGMLS
jgi:hypothetical protein